MTTKTEITFTQKDMDVFMDGLMKIYLIIEAASPESESKMLPSQFVYDFKTSAFKILREENAT